MECRYSLSPEQKRAHIKYLKGHNIFITGPGGTGKSVLIKCIFDSALQMRRRIQVCALTGCASLLLNCNAKTLHSWSGIGLAKGGLKELIDKIKRNRDRARVWKQIDVLVVDEVSMLSSKLFTLLNEIGKEIRGNTRPFGGIQVVFCGDFYQLPPVGDRDDVESMKFCFLNPEWNHVFPKENCVQLIHIFRQKDERFAKILNQIRIGKIKKSTHELLTSLVGREIPSDIKPTKIYPLRNTVDITNTTEMNRIEEEECIFEMQKIHSGLLLPNASGGGGGGVGEKRDEVSEEITREHDSIAKNIMCEKTLKLKVGAQVMCIINQENLCNGSQGVVHSFCSKTKYPIIDFIHGGRKMIVPHLWESENMPGIGVSQLPLILSWAITIHKSQGASIDIAEVDIGSSIFECGQTYVALSRVKSLDGLYLKSYDISQIKVFDCVRQFYKELDAYDVQKETAVGGGGGSAVAKPLFSLFAPKKVKKLA